MFFHYRVKAFWFYSNCAVRCLFVYTDLSESFFYGNISLKMKNEPKFKFWESSEKSFCAIFFNFVFSLVVMLGGQGGHLFRLLYPRHPFFMILLYFASIGRDEILFFCAYKFGNFFITFHRTSLLSSLISRVSSLTGHYSPLFNVLNTLFVMLFFVPYWLHYMLP